MSFTDEPGSPPPDTREPAHYVAFLEHWAAEFPTVPRSRQLAEESAPPVSGDQAPTPPAFGADVPSAIPPPPPRAPGAEPARGVVAEPDGPLQLPRRREATENLRIHLAPEHLYWLRLTAARTGAKVDESVLIAAGLVLLAERAIDWRAMRTRGDLRAALAAAPHATPPPPLAWTAAPSSEP